jgi:predicted membrane metal-binding protein
MYISMSYSISYALSFAAVTAIVVHTYLYNGSEIWAKVRFAPLYITWEICAEL